MSTASNRRPLVRSSPSSWTEPNRRTKKCGKETLRFKRSWQSESGGPARKYKKSPRQQGAKRKFSVNNNDLPYFSKRYRRDETVMPSTSGYNLRPRRGAKVKSQPANEKRTQEGGPVQSRGSREKQQTVQTLRRGAKKVKQQEYQKQKWETTAWPGEERRRTATDPSPWRS
ncbi:uncharacterized protein TNIN_309641 [Trichonephila inaurata madagascariensis]|uniref:Uncharacterized protein n=1 Tax=Trichonephila inaurata madagascariensis TaxID=2747483 RepID=A0A8X6XE18_9ARAC|nr:uncharacterized protein TNIN_309641 [Trichonephila inaurata madagascariensis]